jgi:hypothetical protein
VWFTSINNRWTIGFDGQMKTSEDILRREKKKKEKEWISYYSDTMTTKNA